jgi:TPR repeat protein
MARHRGSRLRPLYPLLFCCLATLSLADSDELLDQALDLATAGDYQGAVQIWNQLAREHNPAALYNLSIVYEKGIGQEPDLNKAAELCLEAAELGHLEAEAHMGTKYLFGMGVEQNHDKSLAWFQLAAEREHAGALATLGNIYTGNHGIPEDLAKSLHYWSRAALAGHLDSTYNLGLMYERGLGGARVEMQKALPLYEVAASGGSVAAMANLADLYTAGERVPQDFAKAYFWCELSVATGLEDNREQLTYLKAQLSPEQLAAVTKEIANWQEIRHSYTDF